MEITAYSQVGINIAVFKIDLIVWKYMEYIKTIQKNIKFKIDLIVWKYLSLQMIWGS